MKNLMTILAGPAAALILSTSAALATDAAAPTENKGLTVFAKDAFELGAQIPAMEGYQVRVRQVTMAPGGVVAAHGHESRPGAFFVVSGDGVTEHRGESKTLVAPGTAVLESKDVDHWVVNHGDEAHLFVFDIVPVEN